MWVKFLLSKHDALITFDSIPLFIIINFHLIKALQHKCPAPLRMACLSLIPILREYRKSVSMQLIARKFTFAFMVKYPILTFIKGSISQLSVLFITPISPPNLFTTPLLTMLNDRNKISVRKKTLAQLVRQVYSCHFLLFLVPSNI